MTVQQLIDELQKVPDKTVDVLFDTEAGAFNVHMVAVDSCHFEEEPRPHVGLHTKEPRHYRWCPIGESRL